MNKRMVIQSLRNLISNSNVDPDSDLYKQAVMAVDVIEESQLVDLKTEIAIVWCIDDVLDVRPDLTEDQAGEVLSRVEDIHDCNLGVTWDTLRIVADDMFEEPEEDEDD